MDFLYSFPAFAKVGCCFVAILLLYRVGVPLGWSILSNTVLLTLWTGNGMGGLGYLLRSAFLAQNFLLLIVIMLLLFFSDALSETGLMENAVAGFRSIFRNRKVTIAGLPALIGLLPMPGGALFSAPLVASADDGQTLSAHHKSAINYWFRHIWEHWWPLYPGVILAVHYSGLPLGLFLLIQLPFTAASVAGGYFFILRSMPALPGSSERPAMPLRSALLTLWPIGFLVVTSIGGSALLPQFGVPKALANLYSMLGGMALALTFIFRNNGGTLRRCLKKFTRPAHWSLTLIVASVLAFSAILQMPLGAQNMTLVAQMRDEFTRMGVPMVLVIIVIPFISGAVTGIAVGFVGASFPIVFALLGAHPPLNVVLAATSLAYASGYLGEMLSPVHICYILSNDYFKARLLPTYRYLLGPAAVVGAAAVVFCSLYLFVFR